MFYVQKPTASSKCSRSVTPSSDKVANQPLYPNIALAHPSIPRISTHRFRIAHGATTPVSVVDADPHPATLLVKKGRAGFARQSAQLGASLVAGLA